MFVGEVKYDDFRNIKHTSLFHFYKKTSKCLIFDKKIDEYNSTYKTIYTQIINLQTYLEDVKLTV
jgi:hypothetical protein